MDKDGGALRAQVRAMQRHFPDTSITYHRADFSRSLSLPPLDGVLMANSLHFHRGKAPILQQVHGWLKEGGTLIVVEYNSDHGNWWVPHPFSFSTWERLAAENGFDETRLLATYPSRFLREIYAAASMKRERPQPA